MKNHKMWFVFSLLLVLLLCGCAGSADSGAEATIPTNNSFANVDAIYKDVLKTHADRGYVLMDLDGNGTDELLITDGEQIYALYVICDDGQLREMLNRSNYIVEIRLCSDNRIFVHETDFNGCDYYSVLAVRTEVGNLPQELFVLCDGDQWWAGPYEKDAEPTTEAEAMALLEAIEFQQIDYLPFS